VSSPSTDRDPDRDGPPPAAAGDIAGPAAATSRKSSLTRWLRLLPAVLLAVVLYREKPWARAWPTLSWTAVAAMCAINFGIYLPMKAWRWKVALAAPPRFSALYASMLEGLLVSTAVGFGSGDVVRSARLRGAGSFTADYGATMAERGAELVAVAILLLLGGTVANLGWPAIAGALACLLVYALGLVFGRRLLPRLRRWPKVAAGVSAGLDASTPRRVIVMTLLSLAGWLSEVGILMIGLHAFGLPSSVATGLLVLLGINVAIVVPGPPANFGTFEAGVVAALGIAGVAVDPALLFGLGYHLIMTIPVALTGAVVFAVRGRRS
jgi:uncharacterized membrane protein YbhN (UPF0104 family)